MSNENDPVGPPFRLLFERTSIGVILAASVVISLVAVKFFHRDSAVPAVSAEDRPDGQAADVGDDDGVENSPWGESANGLQFRLRAERLTWQSWQRPVVVLDVRNSSKETIPAEKLQSLLTLQRHYDGPLMIHKPTDQSRQSRYWDREVQVEVAVGTLTELKPGDSLSLPIAIQSASRSYEAGLQADQIEVGLGRPRPPQEP
ncbi:MAG TPA: hypothetical protein VK137_03420, partial [Planctomycetaceae bacterium]|nr:hypothetical protein [Planctomycetaceae bacterium]